MVIPFVTKNDYGTVKDGTYVAVPDGAQPAIGAQSSAAPTTPTQISQIQQPPTYISSTDVAGQFSNDKAFIDQRSSPPGTPSGDPIREPTPEETERLNSAAGKTPPKTSAQEQSGNLSTYSSRLASGQDKFDAQLAADTAEAKSRLQTTLSTLGVQYDGTKTSITSQYANLIKQTERLKALDVGRRNAYGLGSAVYDPIGHTDSITQATNEWNAEIAKYNTERDVALQKAHIAYEEGKAGSLAASRKEITDIEDRIRTSTQDFQTKLADQLKTANDAIKLKYQEFDERGKLAAQRALVQFAAYKAAKTPEERDKLISEAIWSVGGDPNNAAEYAAVKDALDTKITSEAKTQFEAEKNKLDLEKTRSDIAHTSWTEHRTENQDAINNLIERAKLGDSNALSSLGISSDGSNKVRLTNKEAITVQNQLSNDGNLIAINKAMDTWRSLSSYEDQVKKTGASSIWSPVDRGNTATKYQTAILNAKEYFNLGVLNGPDQAILMEVLPSANSSRWNPLPIAAPYKATNAINGISNLKTQFSDKLDNDFLAVASRFANYDEEQVPGLKDAKRKYIQTKAEIDPKVSEFVKENPDLSADDIIQVINSRL